jgi:hypothetical protein
MKLATEVFRDQHSPTGTHRSPHHHQSGLEAVRAIPDGSLMWRPTVFRHPFTKFSLHFKIRYLLLVSSRTRSRARQGANVIKLFLS